MAGPWEDYQSPAGAPWLDFKPQQTAPIAAPTPGPWTDFAPQAQPRPQQEQGSPGLLDYTGEVAKRFARDMAESAVATRLRGVAGVSAPRFSLNPQQQESAYELVKQGVDPEEARQRVIASGGQPQEVPIQQTPLYQAGEAVTGAMSSFLPDKQTLNPVVSDIAGGFGSVAGNIAGFLIPGGALATAATTPLTGAGEAAERAVKAGATQDQIRRAAMFGNISGATEFADALVVGLGTPGKVAGLLQKVGPRVLMGIFVEGGQEGVQQAIQNWIAKGVYNPKQDIMDVGGDNSVLYSMFIGGIVGGGMAGISRSQMPLPQGAESPTMEPLPSAPEPQVPTPQPTVEAAGEPVTPLGATTDELRRVTIPRDITDFIDKQAKGLSVPDQPTPIEDLLAQQEEIEKRKGSRGSGTSPRELGTNPRAIGTNPRAEGTNPRAVEQTEQLSEIERQEQEFLSTPGANTGRLARLLGPKLYGDPSDIAAVSVKEMMQNSFDSLKGLLSSQALAQGNINIATNPKTRSITITDNGAGMAPEVLGKEFLQIAGTKKETAQASGGFGIAKMLYLFGNKNLRAVTMRNGKVAELNTSGEELFAALDDPTKAPRIQVRAPTAQDRVLFPNGHGTHIQVVVPKRFNDPATGEERDIAFPTRLNEHQTLQYSPLFHNINVKFNGEELSIGQHFPIEEYTPFANVKFDWGRARIYVEKEGSAVRYLDNTHVLVNGLFQFNTEIKKDPSSVYGENIPHNVYIDVQPNVEPTDAGYPFDLNRQDFAPQARKAFKNLTNYVGLIYRRSGLVEEAHNFGTMQFLDYDPETKGVRASKTEQIVPKAPEEPDPFSPAMLKGDVRVDEDGKLFVNGREIPELTPQQIEKFKINTSELKVDQDLIDPKRTILHDNVEIQVSIGEARSVIDYGRERFGQRFYEFNLAIGSAFRELRDIVVRDMPVEELVVGGVTLKAEGDVAPTNNYAALGREGIGVSYDREYRGVSIRIPFAGMFLNPVVPEYTDTIRAAVGMVGTMVHELAHFMERNHNASFVAEMQRILIMLDTNPNFDFHQFKQKVVNIVSTYNDVFNHMNGVFTSGDFTIRSRGKRFEDTSSDQARDGRVSSDPERFGSQPTGGQRLSDWYSKGQAIPPSEQRRGRPAFETSDSRTHRPADNGRSINYNATRGIDPGITAVPIQPETESLRQTIATVAGGSNPQIREAASHADRMNWMWKWTAGIVELLDANPLFQPLRKYVSRVQRMHSDETKIRDAALRLDKVWRGLGEQSKPMQNLIIAVVSGEHLTEQERKLGFIHRNPTQPELERLMRKYKVNDKGKEVYDRIVQMNITSTDLLEKMAIENAQRRIKDPARLLSRIEAIRAQAKSQRETPYFPFTRFGRYYVAKRDAANKILHFETFEPRRVAGVSIKRAEKYQMARAAELRRRAQPGETVWHGVLPETAEPFVSMPSQLLGELLADNSDPQTGARLLTDEQVTAIKLLQDMRTSGVSLSSRFLKNANQPGPPGYSMDFRRAHARHYAYFARYYATMTHGWALRGHIAEAQHSPGNKAGLIASYMQDHLKNTVLDMSGDFGFFRGAIFFWAMGYVPAAATQNMTQTPMVTLPYLAAKFGEHRAVPSMLHAMAKLNSFYKRGTYENVLGLPDSTRLFYDAISYGVKTGRITETQASDLAGIAQGGVLMSGAGGTEFQQKVIAFQEKAAWMFEMMEQYNRRIAYRAAFNLALKNPNNKYVNESVARYKEEYEELVNKPGSNGQPLGEAAARAIVTAIHAVDATQLIYARYARPRFMRGPIGATLFVFKRYTQGMLYMLGNNKADVLPRFLIMAMLMGGLGGVPGYEDMKGIFQAIGRWWFGKEANLDKIIRSYVMDWFGGKLDPDLVLHGLARRGFGIPSMMDMMGSMVTGTAGRGFPLDPTMQHSSNVPYPVLDRSKAISMGNILPFDVGKMFTPTNKSEKVLAEQVQKASGAVFSVGFNMYRAAMDPDSPAGDIKRWERAMPRAIASASRSFRAYSEGRERSGRGGPNSASTIVPFDPRDTEQMMEVLAMAGGYQPLRVQQKWDNIMAKVETQAFFDFKRTGLMQSYFEAFKGGNPKEIEDVRQKIVQFNTELPDFARGRGITADTLQKSMQTRQRNLSSQNLGIPVQRSNVGISREMDRLFPDAISVQKVR